MHARGLSCCRTSFLFGAQPSKLCHIRRVVLAPNASKGFSAEGTEPTAAKQVEPSASTATEVADELSIENRIRSRRKRPAPKVKVVNAALEAAKAAQDSPTSQAETFFISVLSLVFVLILAEGLIVAASGFLSEDLDQLVQDVVYPAFTPTVGLFLASSALYGLWKTGKLPGQRQL